MKVLLDTHAWIWYLAGSAKLPKVLRETIEDEENGIWLSPISVLEAIVLGEKGRIKLEPNPILWARDALKECCFREAPINTEIAIRSREIRLPHQDPADRLLAATAIIYGIKLATVDKVLLKAKWLPIMKPKTPSSDHLTSTICLSWRLLLKPA